MEESQENDSLMPPGEEGNKDTADVPGGPQCPYCGSSEVFQDEESGDWSCGQCGRRFEPQPEAAGRRAQPGLSGPPGSFLSVRKRR